MSKVVVAVSLAALGLVAFGLPGLTQDAVAQEAGAQDVPSASDAAAPSAADGAASKQGSDLPEVKIIQEVPKPVPPPVQAAAPKPKPKPKKVVAQPAPPPQQAPVEEYQQAEDDFSAPAEISEPAQIMANSPYGATGGAGAAQRAEFGNIAPINARTTLPGDLQNFAGAGSRVAASDFEQQRPQTAHEALARVPGVITVNDDGIGRAGGTGIRGSSPRRSRKILVMEDGQAVNFASYLDSSTHYTPPMERVESIEVTRGYVVNQGPLNNHGIINFRNVSPFGANETVLKFGIGHTWEHEKDWNNTRHVHTRQGAGNWGVVASYSGTDYGGSWDNEVLRYNDFYGAIGVKGDDQDLTVSGGYHRQRDDFDEDNFLRGDLAAFKVNRHRKAGLGSAAQPGPFEATFGHDFSTFSADYFRLQVAHNYYFDKDTTLSTRLYGSDTDRARFFPDQTDAGDPLVMAGRDRRYRTHGVDSRIEFANRQFFDGMTYDLQVGVRYEKQTFNNMNREGDPGEILSFNNRGALDDQQKLDANAFAAYVQAAIHLTPALTVTPGLRFENYETAFKAVVGDDEVLDFFNEFGALESQHSEVLPGLAFAWEVAPRSTIYGSYHRGLTPQIIRDVLGDPFDDAIAAGEGAAFARDYQIDDEIGDNFQLGYRTTAIRGVTLDAAVFHNRIQNYQFGEAFQTPDGDRVFSGLDKVEFNGFEVAARIDSQPFTGGPWNVFTEAAYTYTDTEITKNDGNPGAIGNEVPEAIKHFANLTLGVAYKKLWDAGITATYRGGWYIDEDNTEEFGFEDGEITPGKIDGQWTLSARANYHMTDKLTLWATGANLTNELYLAGVEDGVKPSIARTVMGGFTVKFD